MADYKFKKGDIVSISATVVNADYDSDGDLEYFELELDDGTTNDDIAAGNVMLVKSALPPPGTLIKDYDDERYIVLHNGDIIRLNSFTGEPTGERSRWDSLNHSNFTIIG